MIALIRMTAGLILWGIAFAVLYGLHGIGCAAGWAGTVAGPVSVQHLVLGTVWIGFVAGGIALAWASRRGGDELVERTAWRLGVVGAAATLVTGLPIVTLPACV